MLEAPDEVSEVEEKKVEGKIKKRLVKYSKYLANGVFKEPLFVGMAESLDAGSLDVVQVTLGLEVCSEAWGGGQSLRGYRRERLQRHC